jgi:hypothetical protein
MATHRRRRLRWDSAERAVRLAVSLAGEVIQLIELLRGGR